jgi:hypothetical protein
MYSGSQWPGELFPGDPEQSISRRPAGRDRIRGEAWGKLVPGIGEDDKIEIIPAHGQVIQLLSDIGMDTGSAVTLLPG